MRLPAQRFTNEQLGLICTIANRSLAVNHPCNLEMLPTVEETKQALTEGTAMPNLTHVGQARVKEIMQKLEAL